MTSMHRRVRAALMVAVLPAAACGGRGERPTEAATPTAAVARPRALRDVTYERTASRRERGRYLTEGVLQCFLCHSDREWTRPGAPPAPNAKGAGHVWKGREWLVSPNITPDPETGAGRWTDDMLARAIREGIGHDGRVLHPQMWYGSFRSLSDEDLASVIVYVRSLPPIRRALPTTTLPAGRPPLAVPAPLVGPVPAPDMRTPVARGAYLVRVADCAGCHTAWEAPLVPGFFGGGNPISLDGRPRVFSANLTRDVSGIGSYYDAALFREVMRSGHLRGRALDAQMPWIVFGNMTDEDLDAVFAYLQSRRPVRHNVSNTDPPTPCPICGQTHGLGDRNTPKALTPVSVDARQFADEAGEYRFPDDAGIWIATDGTRLFLRYEPAMPPIPLVAVSDTEFTAAEIPDVISFVRDARGHVTGLLTNVDEVATKRPGR